MRITHITLKNWRNFRDVDADIGDRLFIVGPNASGKSNLLDSLRFVRDVVKVGGGFQQAVASRGGLQRIRCLAARNYNHGRVGIALSVGGPTNEERWDYDLTFTAESRGQHRPIVTSEVVRHNGDTVLDRPDEQDREDEERLTQTALEQVNANRGFRDLVDFCEAIRYLHLVPQVLRRTGERCG